MAPKHPPGPPPEFSVMELTGILIASWEIER